MKKHAFMHKSRRFRRFLRADRAVSALEYAILVGVIAVAVGAAIVAFSGNLSTAMSAIGADVANITTTGAGPLTGTPTTPP